MKRIISGLIVLLLILFSANCVVANNSNSARDGSGNDLEKGDEGSFFVVNAFTPLAVSSSIYADNMALTAYYISLGSVEYPIIQINVKLGDKEGKEDIRQYEYIAKVYNSSQEQIGEDIILRLNGNPDNSLSTVAHGTACLPSDVPEGNYYVFVYQNNANHEFILPFMCKKNEKLEACCNSSSMTYLISEDVLVENCSKFWCCGCNCPKPQVKNSIYIKKDGTGEDPGEEDKPTYVYDMDLPSRHNISESTRYPINVTLGDENGRNDTKKYTYIAKVFNSGQEQVGEDIDLTLTNPFDDEDTDPTSNIEAQGMVYLPVDTPEGNYYLFVYQNNTIYESILPFIYNSSENLTPCCNATSCITNLTNGEDLIANNCSESWCCGCNCTENDAKNKIYIENEDHGNNVPDEDTKFPVIHSVTLNNTTPNTGEQIKVSVNVTDNIGVTSVKAGNEHLTRQNDTIWEGNITAVVGTNFVNVSAVDEAENVAWNNSTSYTATTPDEEEPIIHYVTLNNTTPNTGEQIKVSVNVTDNIGVTSVKAGNEHLTRQNNTIWEGNITAVVGTNFVNVSAVDEAENVAWNNSTSYTATTPDTEEPEIVSVDLNNTTPNTGELIKVSVNVTDNIGVTSVKAGNEHLTRQNNTIWEGNITAVVGTNFVNVSAVDEAENVAWNNSTSYTATTPDEEEPIIHSVTLNNTTPNTGEQIKVSVNVTDNIGVTSVKAGNEDLTRQNDTIWEGNITAVVGTNFVNVSAVDEAENVAWNNSTSYTATTPDEEEPIIYSVTLNNTTPNTGEQIKVSVNVTDNIGVTSVKAGNEDLTRQNDTIWEGNITAIVGTNFVNVSAVDEAENVAWNNSTSYTATTPDTEAPEIVSVDLNNTTPNTGEQIKVSVNVTDNIGVTSVKAGNEDLTRQNDTIWEGNITAVVGTNFVNVSAVDEAENVAWNNSTSYTATTPDTDEGNSNDGTDDDEGGESIDDEENNIDDGEKPSKRKSNADRGTLPIRKKETTESISLPPESRMSGSDQGLSINALAKDGNQNGKEKEGSSGFDRLILYFLAAMFGLLLAFCGSIFSRYYKLQKE